MRGRWISLPGGSHPVAFSPGQSPLPGVSGVSGGQVSSPFGPSQTIPPSSSGAGMISPAVGGVSSSSVIPSPSVSALFGSSPQWDSC
jgi:hypothetical protein